MVVFYRVLRVVVRNPGTGQLDVLRGHREAAVLYRRVRRCPSAERVAFQDWRFRYGYRRVRLHLSRCRYLRRSLRHFSRVLVAYFELVQIEVQLQYKAAVRRDRSAEHVALMIRVKRILPVLAVCLVRLRHACFRRRRSMADVARVRDIAAFDLLMVVFYRVLRVVVRFQRNSDNRTTGYVIQRPIIGSIRSNAKLRFSAINADRGAGFVRLDAGHLIPNRNVHIQPNISAVQRIIGEINLKDIADLCRPEIRRTTQV